MDITLRHFTGCGYMTVLLFVTCSMMLAPSTYRRTSTFRLASEPYLADMRVAFPGWYTDMSHGLMNLGVRDDEWIHDE